MGKEMIMLLINKIFALSDAKRITADVDQENIASQKVLGACGFSKLGRSQGQHVRYVLTKESTNEI